jgi:hypothetical protein
MGGKLGTVFARAGHEVVFSYAQQRGGAQEARTGGPKGKDRFSIDWLLLQI